MKRREFIAGMIALLPGVARAASPSPHDYYDGAAGAPKASDYYDESPAPTPPSPAPRPVDCAPPVVEGYSPTWCTGCKLAMRECEALAGIVEIRWHTDSRGFPESIKSLIANGGVYPVLWWTTPNGPRQISNGWKGVHDFTTRYDRSMAAQVATAKTATQPPQPPAKVAPAQSRPRYPIRGGWWNQDGHMVTWHHLTQGEHAGKFDHAWLASLSYEEVQSLHSDDHEGHVHWDRVVRPGGQVQHASVQYQQPARRSTRRAG